MSYHAAGPIKCLRIISAATLLGSIQPALHAHAASIVLGEIEYTRDGRVDDDGRSAIETYIEFFLSRLHNHKSQRVSEYIRNCAPKEPDGSCPYPDFYIQLQLDERQGEVQISGAVGQKIEAKNFQPYNLESIRVKFRDLADGLSNVAKNIDTIITKSAAPTERAHVVIGCFEPSFNAPRTSRPRRQSQTRGPTSVISGDSYTDRLPRMLERLMPDEPRIRVSISMDAGADCSSLEALQAIAQRAGAEAVLTGRVFTDDRSGLIIVPQIFITEASKKILLPVISIPSGADAAASYELVARRLAAVSYALVGSAPRRGELVQSIANSTELSYYLGRAKQHLSFSPPEYDAADALLELAKWKAPADQQSYLLLGSSLTARMLYTEAATTLRSGIDQIPHGKALYIALAENFIRAGDLPQARRVYEEALNANILAEDALLGIARTHLLGRRSFEKAMEYALQAVAQNPSSTDAYVLAGQIAEAQNRFEKAEMYYQKARKLSPESAQIASRLSSLYERWQNQDRSKGNLKNAIDILNKSIDVLPSEKKYFDRAAAYLQFYLTSGERSKGYELASADFMLALQIARKKNTVLAQFPWLMPNLIETLIFEGKFKEAKRLAEELFAALASDSSIRSSTDPKDIRLIATFLNATAQILDAGSAEKELYLFENTALGMDFGRLTWSFAEMSVYLDQDYPQIMPQVHPDDREMRVAAIKQLIGRLSSK